MSSLAGKVTAEPASFTSVDNAKTPQNYLPKKVILNNDYPYDVKRDTCKGFRIVMSLKTTIFPDSHDKLVESTAILTGHCLRVPCSKEMQN